MAEIGMATCRPVRSALTKKGSRGSWMRSRSNSPDVSSCSLFSLEGLS